MAAFNSMTGLSSGTTPNDGLGLNVAGQSVTMDGIDPALFDDSLLDSVNGAFPPLPFTPSYDFQDFSGFEDPFSYSARPFEAPPPQEDFNEDSPAQELDNKLLGFSAPLLKAAIIDESGQNAEVNMTAELYGMFFVAEDVFGGETAGRPLELTCYRRNLWQCSGLLMLPRHVTHAVNEQGRQIPIFELAVSITAIESIEGKTTEIISIPWKSSSAVGGEEPKVASGPPNIVLDLGNGQEVDANRVSLPVAWKRLQFKHATANNGRRKGLQQHYVVQINLLGKQKSGEFIKIAEIQSGPVIVRGRSPRNFDSKKDIPLSGDKKLERKSTTGDTPLPKESNGLPNNPQRYHSLGNIHQAGEWTTPQAFPQQGSSQPAAKKLALSPNVSRPPIPSWSTEPARQIGKGSGITSQVHRPGISGPINLSLSEDERSPNRSTSDLQSPQFSKTAAPIGQNPSQSPVETADLLYEYFPLSVDDWMPPVEAIYRPHVVHHTITPPEIKAQQMRSKTKRYFTAES